VRHQVEYLGNDGLMKGKVMRSRRLWTIIILIILVILFLVLLFLFRTQTVDNPALGVITFKYKWGRVHQILADSNRDGRIDYRELTSAPFGAISTHTSSALQYWEDADFDGHFERHAILEHGEIKILEIDEDTDGVYEKILTGEEARKFYEAWRLARPQGDLSDR